MIKFKDVSKVYPNGNQSLSNINLNIESGEFVFLVGHSGAGKSTLLKLLLKEEDVTTGSLNILGQDIKSMNKKNVHKFRRNLGIVFQDFRLLNDKTVYENVEFAMRVVGQSPRNIKTRVPEVLELVGLSDKAKCYPSQLSGGEAQRVGIARAIVNNPAILIADECTGNLDYKTSREIMKILIDINKKGTTVVMATHALNLLEEFMTRVIMLHKGSIIRDTKGGVYENIV
jgi:cell division transport system ATP-binding protein